MSGYVYRLISLAAAEALEKNPKDVFLPQGTPPRFPPIWSKFCVNLISDTVRRIHRPPAFFGCKAVRLVLAVAEPKD